MNTHLNHRSIYLSGLCVILFSSIAYNSTKGLIASTIPPVRAHHALVYDEASKNILMTAGSTPLNEGQSFDFYNDLWSFDGKAWTQQGIAGNKRSGIQLAYDSKRNKVYSFGGYSGDSSLSDLRVLEGTEWKTLSWLPNTKAAEAGFVYDAGRDRLIVFGGSGGQGLVNSETWEWDGAAWNKFNGSGPEGRQAFAMIYDSKRKKTVLYGGMGSSPGQAFQETWEFDGAQWKKVNDKGPGTRLSPGFAFDSKRGMMILFGGISGGKIVGDTWGWDGKEWKKLSDTGPTARVMGYMAYDKARDKTVLFGGRIRWPNDANDTWEWDGENWKEIKSE